MQEDREDETRKKYIFSRSCEDVKCEATDQTAVSGESRCEMDGVYPGYCIFKFEIMTGQQTHQV